MKLVLVIFGVVTICLGYKDECNTKASKKLLYSKVKFKKTEKPRSSSGKSRNNVMKSTPDDYRPDYPLAIIIHDHYTDVESYSDQVIINTFRNHSFNIMTCQWADMAFGSFATTIEKVPEVGQFFDDFAYDMISEKEGDWNTVHVVGIGLGAHIAGYLSLSKLHPKPAKITALDPPDLSCVCKENTTRHCNGTSSSCDCGGPHRMLQKSDATYVEVFHTNFGVLGLNKVVGHTDIFFNGGQFQPGCDDYGCSHLIAVDYFAESSIQVIEARQCACLEYALNNKCTGNNIIKVGGIDLSPKTHGIYGLSLALPIG